MKTPSKPNVPVTARGRALYTVEWFLHGVVQAGHYDQANLYITQLAYKETDHVYA